MSMVSQSLQKAIHSRHNNTKHGKARSFAYVKVSTAKSPMLISERKYRKGMRLPQHFVLPFSNSHVRTGILRYKGMFFRQCGQCERGLMTDCPFTQRSMQTLRKLPMQLPKRNKQIASMTNIASFAKGNISAWCHTPAHWFKRFPLIKGSAKTKNATRLILTLSGR